MLTAVVNTCNASAFEIHVDLIVLANLYVERFIIFESCPPGRILFELFKYLGIAL